MTLITAFIALVVALSGIFWYRSSDTPSAPTITREAITRDVDSVRVSVDRSDEGLTKMPEEILRMESLQELNLSGNNLSGALPAEIRHLSRLEVLDISGNRMTGLPAELGQLSKLRILNASNNQLTGIPRELGNLQNLELLDLSGNDISQEDLQIIKSRLPASAEIRL